MSTRRQPLPIQVERPLRRRLARSGINLPTSYGVWDVAVRFFDYLRRRVAARPREVLPSTRLEEVELSTAHRVGLDCIIADLEQGRPLDRYFSRSWLHLERNDIAFNDWMVRHLHLGAPLMCEDGFVERTGPVLFTHIARERAYLVDIMPHGEDHATAFSEARIVDTLHTNWPELIAHGLVPGVSDIRFNDPQFRHMVSRRRRGPHATVGVETADGTVYMAIGGGYMMDGRSGTAVECANMLLERLHEWQKLCEQPLVDSFSDDFDVRVRVLQWGLELSLMHAGSNMAGGRIMLPLHQRC